MRDEPARPAPSSRWFGNSRRASRGAKWVETSFINFTLRRNGQALEGE